MRTLAATGRVTSAGPDAEAARPVSFDRPLVANPSWADPGLGRQVAAAARRAREQALAAGYAAGWAQGRLAAATRERAEQAERSEREEVTRGQLQARVQTLLASLTEAARTLTEAAVPVWDELADVLVDGSLAIVAAGLGRELSAVDAEVLEAVRTAARFLPAEPLVVHVHPDDVALVSAQVLVSAQGLVGGQLQPAGLRVVADAAIARGTVLARTALQSLPLDLKAALHAAEEVLRA